MKKKLFIINGNACVGKSTTSQHLMKELPNCVRLDGDWCLEMHPNTSNPETRELRYHNCCLLLNNFIHATTIENIVFCLKINNQKRIDWLLSQLDLSNVDVLIVTLIVNEKAYIRRAKRAIKHGEKGKFYVANYDGKPVRQDYITHRLMEQEKFKQLPGIKIDTSNLSICKVVQKIKQISEQA